VVARLVIDVVWRNRWTYVLMSPMLILFWLTYVAGGSGAFSIGMPALSLVATAVLGPSLAPVLMGLRELRHLPVTSRDIWRTTWVAAVILAPTFVLVTQTITALLFTVFGARPAVSIETMLLSSVYDVAWAGALLPLFPLSGYLGRALSRHGRAVGALPLASPIALLLGCFGLPMLISDALPTSVAAFTPATTPVLVACFAIAFAALVWTPQRGAPFGERGRPRPAYILATDPMRKRLADRLTGIPRVTVPSLLTTIAVVVGACIALAVYGVASGSGAWWFVPRALDPFDRAYTGDRGLTYVLLVPCGLIAMIGIWTPWARLLKVLPLSVRRINALLLITPFATWVWLWLVGLAVYSLAYGPPPTFRLDLPFGLAGISALAHATLLRFQGRVPGIAFIGAMLPPLLEGGLRDGTSAQIAFSIIGAIALGVAAVINHRTLTLSTSSSSVYRRPQPPFGMRTSRPTSSA